MKSSTLATFIFFGSVICSPHRHLHHHAARHPNQQEESPVTWVTEVVVKTVQVTATVWVTPLAEPTHVLVERPVSEEVVSTPNIPAQFFKSLHSTGKDIPSSEITPESNDINHLTDPQPSTEKVSPSSEITPESNDINHLTDPQPSTEKVSPLSEITPESNDKIHFTEPQSSTDIDSPSHEIAPGKNDHPNDETTTKNQPSETVTQLQVNYGENHEVTKPWSNEIKAPEPSTPSEPLTVSPQIPSEASLGSNITAIHDHATAATCSSSSPCDGDITYYDPGVGYGACGWKNTKNEPVVALPHEFMGSRSNGNSYCGKTITIVRDGKKSTARVVDKCMGCTGYSIDLSDAVFSQLAALSVGRTSAKWWVN